MTVEHCNTCLFYMDVGGPIGVCRRFPQFQNRSKMEWCGEHSGLLKLPVVEKQQIDEVKRRGRPKKEVSNDQASE